MKFVKFSNSFFGETYINYPLMNKTRKDIQAIKNHSKTYSLFQ